MILNLNNKQGQYLAKLRWWLFLAASVLLISFVVLMAALRLALPYLATYEDEIEKQLQQTLDYPVQITRLDADWYWFSPRIKLLDVSVFKKDKRSQLVRFDEVIFEFGIMSNLLNLSFEPTVITLNGSHLFIETDKQGQLYIQGVPVAAGTKEDRQPAENTHEQKILSVLNDKLLELNEITLQWTDKRRSPASLTFKDVRLAVEFDDGNYNFYLNSDAPDQVGEKILLIAELEKNKESWFTNLYIDAKAANLDFFMQYIKTPGFELSSRLDANLWLKLDGLKVNNVKGMVAASDLVISGKNATDKKSWSTQNLSSAFQLDHVGDEWSLVIDNLNLQLGNNDWKNLYFSLSYNQKNNALGLRSEYMDLSDVYQLAINLPLNEALVNKISSLNPKGVLRKTDVYIDDWMRPDSWLLKTRFENFGLSLTDENIRFDGISGDLRLENDKGRLLLDSKKASLVSAYFNEPLVADELNGLFKVERNAGTFNISSENVLANIDSVDVRARLDIDFNDQVLIDMQMKIEKADAKWLNRHRADGLLGKRTGQWLSTAIIDAELRNFNFLFHGNVSGLPFEKNEGVMQYAVDVSKGVFKYLPDWPGISDINGRLAADNHHITFDAQTGFIGDSQITDTLTTLNLTEKNRRVVVQGNVSSDNHGLDSFFMATPLSKTYQSLTQYTRIEGGLKCELGLDIPLRGKSGVGVDGRLHLQGNKLKVKDYGYELDNIHGVVDFKNALITADHLTAHFNQQPIQVSISTQDFGTGTGGDKKTTLKTHFKADVKNVVPFDIEIAELIKNETDWALDMQFNHAPIHSEMMSLTLQANMKNIDVMLPPPFLKKADKDLDFSLGIKLFPDYSDLVLHYGDLLDLAMRWDREFKAVRSDIRLNTGRAVLPEKGIRLSAELLSLDLKQWEKVVLPFFAQQDSHIVFDDVQLNMDADTLQYDQYQISKANIKAKLLNGGWNLAVNSNEMTATARFLKDINYEQPVNVRFSALDLSSVLINKAAVETDVSPVRLMSPNKIPALNVSGKNFVYKKYSFDSVAFKTTQSDYGLTLHNLTLNGDAVTVKAKGNWFAKKAGTDHSSFRIEVESDNVGKMLSSYGFSNSIKKGEGKAMIDWQWPASPLNFDWKLVKGRMDVDVNNGRFVDIEPGAGRLLGVFSLSALPRRFMLDFSDTFTEGFEFDEFKSQASFSDGQLYTSKTSITGTSADVYFKGRIGLADKDYDQVMSVVPRISSGVSGWLAVLQGATVGIVAYVGQKLLGVDEAAQNQYHITGSWSDPVIKKLDTKMPPSVKRKHDEQ